MPSTNLDRSSITMDMNKLSREQRAMIVPYLCDGVSIRATGRIRGTSKNTIQKLTRDLGAELLQFQDNALQVAGAG
jgi:hypothetical protein